MDEDKKIKDFLTKEDFIPETINKTFDKFIKEIQEEKPKEKVIEISKYKFQKVLSIAASCAIIFLGANVYATTKGYDNIFFMIKDTYKNITLSSKQEIFSDREITISYQPLYITNSITLQINKLVAYNNEAKLNLTVKEKNSNITAPLKYEVYNEDNKLMCSQLSSKEEGKNEYLEILNLKNFSDSTNILNLKVYSNKNELLKTIKINLENKTIEAKTENEKIEKISQIKLNQFLSEQTKKKISINGEEDSEILILQLYDISYSNYEYIVKYLYCLPTKEDYKNDNVENLTIYTNTVTFTIENDEYILKKIEDFKIFNKNVNQN